MPANALSGFEPRKTPIQTRAAVTVGAISEATIQVLLKQGVNRLTTTRVAEIGRASCRERVSKQV